MPGNFASPTTSQTAATTNNQIGAQTSSGAIEAVSAGSTGNVLQSGSTNLEVASGGTFNYDADTSIVEQASQTAQAAANATNNAINGSNQDATTALQTLVDTIDGRYSTPATTSSVPTAGQVAAGMVPGTDFSKLTFIATTIGVVAAIIFYARQSK